MDIGNLYDDIESAILKKESQNKKLSSKISELKDEIKQLERFRDDLKCCGNCKKRDFCDIPETIDMDMVCDNWQFDGLHQKDRRIE